MIAQTERLMDFWRENLPNPILTVCLADWVEDFDATLARVLDHIGLPFDPGCADFHKSDAPVKTASKHQVREPINARGLGRWKRHAPELAPLIAALEEAGALAGWDTPTVALSPEEGERASVFERRLKAKLRAPKQFDTG
jgi:hypothetical protein